MTRPEVIDLLGPEGIWTEAQTILAFARLLDAFMLVQEQRDKESEFSLKQLGTPHLLPNSKDHYDEAIRKLLESK